MRKKVWLPHSLEELQRLDNERHKELWLRYFKELPSKFNTALPMVTDHKIIRTLWYKVQCETHNLRIEQKFVTMLNRYSTNPDKYIEKSHKVKYHIRSGTELFKTYRGQQHKVLVKSDNEFVYNGQTYKTLSAAALAICHKKVSGYDFFGLNNKLYQKNVVEKAEEETDGEQAEQVNSVVSVEPLDLVIATNPVDPVELVEQTELGNADSITEDQIYALTTEPEDFEQLEVELCTA